MQSMVRGFRQAAGVEKSRTTGKSGWLGSLIWILLFAAVAAFAYSRWSP